MIIVNKCKRKVTLKIITSKPSLQKHDSHETVVWSKERDLEPPQQAMENSSESILWIRILIKLGSRHYFTSFTELNKSHYRF